MPAGIAAPGESPQEATIREAIEESGISVELTGILRVRYEPHPGQDDTVRLIVQYIGRPSSEEDEIKSVPDFESVVSLYWNSQPLVSHAVVSGIIFCLFVCLGL